MTFREWIKPYDEEFMADFYNKTDRIRDLAGDGLVYRVEWRTYTEWCCESSENCENYKDYDGEGFEDWVSDETHYALERRGYKWSIWDKKLGGMRIFIKSTRKLEIKF